MAIAPTQGNSHIQSNQPDPVNPPTRRTATATMAVRQQYYSGPIPQAEELGRYNEVIPNGADRIMTMAEKQAAHRQKLETTVIEGDNFRATAGLFVAAVLAMAFIVGGIYLLANDKGAAGITALGIAVVGIAGAFYITRKDKKEQLQEKAEAVPTPSKRKRLS